MIYILFSFCLTVASEKQFILTFAELYSVVKLLALWSLCLTYVGHSARAGRLT